jgi:sec-independent protein translocase protein TatB
MLDIGWSELLVVAVVAIVVIGPRDLPRALRTAGQWVAKVRGIARDFQNSVDDMIRETELDDLKKEAQAITDFDLNESLERQLDPTGGSEAFGPGAIDKEALEDFDEPAAQADYAAEASMAPPHSLTPAAADEAPVSETGEDETAELPSNRASG